ncbi:MAG: hypothetical protein AcusKO_14540 [Acuticoccus sp.]
MTAWPVLAGALMLLAGPAFAQETPAYVGSATCGACHEAAQKAWEGSHHALAWTLPSAGTVVADFDGTTFTHDGMTARFRIAEDGTYHVAVTEKDGSESDYDVKGVVGIEPLQQYLLKTGPGRLQSFDVVWDTEGNRWFHLYPDQNLPPDDGLHWTGPYKNWNGRCAVCHATGFDKNYDGTSRTFASTEAEIGVGCEACHGPGAAHVAWAEGREMPPSAAPLDAIGLLAALDSADTAMDVCGACHSRREPFGAASALPGSSFHDSHNLSLLREGLYHADGQILDEVYVLGSFLQSKMAARGVTCTNCHDPHTAELRAPGNAVCTQCHNPVGRPDFPTLRPADYDSPAHHFHTPGTAGAECKSCHMVERVYMGNDWRADHSFRIPRPDLAAETGAPDACTGCPHRRRSASGPPPRSPRATPTRRNRGPHFGTVLARGRRDPAGAADELAALAEDTALPGGSRAPTAMSLLGGASDAAPRRAPAGLPWQQGPAGAQRRGRRAAAGGAAGPRPRPPRQPRRSGAICADRGGARAARRTDRTSAEPPQREFLPRDGRVAGRARRRQPRLSRDAPAARRLRTLVMRNAPRRQRRLSARWCCSTTRNASTRG